MDWSVGEKMLSSLVKQTALRSAVLIVGKCIGLAGRVGLSRILGAEGIGLYQMAYSFFGLILMTISGGVPTALALFTAKQPNRGWRALQVLSVYTIVIGLVLSYWMHNHAGDIAAFVGNHELIWAIRALSPALIAVPLLQLARGYMQGVRSYEAISVSELTEQALRIAILIILISLHASQGIGYAVGMGLYGTTIAAIGAFLVLTIFAITSKQSTMMIIYSPMNKVGLGIMLRTSVIIGGTRMLVPFSDFIDSLLIPHRLQVAGHSLSESIAMYGIITGMAAVIVYMPTMITAAISHTVTMKIAANYEEGKQSGRDIEKVLRFVWTWGIISGLFIFIYAEEAAGLIFGVKEAAEPIRYLSAIPLIVGLRELTTSILWAQERKHTPLFGLVIGICISILLQYIVIAIPGFGYTGASIGILLLEAIATVWNLRALQSTGCTLFSFKWVGLDLPFFCCVMLLFVPPLLQGEQHLVTIVLTAVFFWICASLLIGMRYRNK